MLSGYRPALAADLLPASLSVPCALDGTLAKHALKKTLLGRLSQRTSAPKAQANPDNLERHGGTDFWPSV